MLSNFVIDVRNNLFGAFYDKELNFCARLIDYFIRKRFVKRTKAGGNM